MAFAVSNVYTTTITSNTNPIVGQLRFSTDTNGLQVYTDDGWATTSNHLILNQGTYSNSTWGTTPQHAAMDPLTTCMWCGEAVPESEVDAHEEACSEA